MKKKNELLPAENLKLKFSRLDSKRSRISSTEDKEKPARKRRSFSVNHGIDRFVTGRSKGVGSRTFLFCFSKIGARNLLPLSNESILRVKSFNSYSYVYKSSLIIPYNLMPKFNLKKFQPDIKLVRNLVNDDREQNQLKKILFYVLHREENFEKPLITKIFSRLSKK